MLAIQHGDVDDEAWRQFYETRRDVLVPSAVSPAAPPDTFSVFSSGRVHDAPVVCVLLHGAGQSSLSFALCAKQLHVANQIPLVALDLRGHGRSFSADNDEDLSVETMVSDASRALVAFFDSRRSLPQLLLIGHSIGGALSIRLANEHLLPIAAVVCIDLVEDTAVQSIAFTRSAIASRPKSFLSEADAIEWSLRSAMIRSPESARISMPAQLQWSQHEQCFNWRTRLEAVHADCWLSWYENLSALFLALKCPKLLLIADVDRLDKAMSIAQMQGKLQVSVVGSCGHQIQEDQATETAKCISRFWTRHSFDTRASKLQQLNAILDQKRALA